MSENDEIRDESKVGSGFEKNISNWLDREISYLTNVLHLATECNNKKHSATFPEGIPEWFIKLAAGHYCPIGFNPLVLIRDSIYFFNSSNVMF
jgi:hypothetical protein